MLDYRRLRRGHQSRPVVSGPGPRILAYDGAEENPANRYWFEGNFAAYEENEVERMGPEAAGPHRLTQRCLTRE